MKFWKFWSNSSDPDGAGGAPDAPRRPHAQPPAPAGEPPETGAEDRAQAKLYRKKGRQYYNQRRYDKAEKAFRKAAQADPLDANISYDLGLAAYQLGASDDAVDAWSNTMRLAPDEDVAGKARRKILMVQKKQQVTTKEDALRDAASVVADLEERMKEY